MQAELGQFMDHTNLGQYLNDRFPPDVNVLSDLTGHQTRGRFGLPAVIQ
jgi:hypothetical protein